MSAIKDMPAATCFMTLARVRRPCSPIACFFKPTSSLLPCQNPPLELYSAPVFSVYFYFTGAVVTNDEFFNSIGSVHPIHCGLRAVPSKIAVVLNNSYLPVIAASRVFCNIAVISPCDMGWNVRATSKA